MVYHRFNALVQGLKATGAKSALDVFLPGAKSTPRFVYKPILSNTNAPIYSALAKGASSDSHGHADVPKEWAGWETWKRWQDVPDHLIPKSSKRDPDNGIYADPEYINFRKRQIWFQLPDGKLVWQKLPGDMFLYYSMIVSLTVLISWIMYEMCEEMFFKLWREQAEAAREAADEE